MGAFDNIAFDDNAFDTGTVTPTIPVGRGFDILLDDYLTVKYQTPVQRTICPNDGWILEDTERGLHCPFCGWTPGIPPHFIPRNPDTTSP